MDVLVKNKIALSLARQIDKTNVDIKLLIIDYKWNDEKINFFKIYVIADNSKVSEVKLIGSGDGEMWDIEIPLTLYETFEENEKSYGLYNLELKDNKTFPRSFVLKGQGNGEVYDNNDNRNYGIKKGRGGNLIPKNGQLILLNNIELFTLFDR